MRWTFQSLHFPSMLLSWWLNIKGKPRYYWAWIQQLSNVHTPTWLKRALHKDSRVYQFKVEWLHFPSKCSKWWSSHLKILIEDYKLPPSVAILTMHSSLITTATVSFCIIPLLYISSSVPLSGLCLHCDWIFLAILMHQWRIFYQRLFECVTFSCNGKGLIKN